MQLTNTSPCCTCMYLYLCSRPINGFICNLPLILRYISNPNSSCQSNNNNNRYQSNLFSLKSSLFFSYYLIGFIGRRVLWWNQSGILNILLSLKLIYDSFLPYQPAPISWRLMHGSMDKHQANNWPTYTPIFKFSCTAQIPSIITAWTLHFKPKSCGILH